MESEKIFKLVGESEAQRIIREASELSTDVLVLDEAQETHFRVLGVGKPGHVAFEVKSSGVEDHIETLLLSFLFEGEKYFSRVRCQVKNGMLTILDKATLYQLQRRAHFRVPIPMNTQAFLNILDYKGKVVFVETKILDLSVGGAKLEIPEKTFTPEIGERFSGTLKLTFRDAIPVGGTVRSVLTKGKEGKIKIGVQFDLKDSLFESRMFTVVMNLYREIYAKKFK